MSNPLIPGFSPYNVPVKSGRRIGAEPRVAPDGQRAQTPAKQAGRWSEPAVQVRLSREALAFLNGEESDKPQQAAAKPSATNAAASAGFAEALRTAGGNEGPAPSSSPQQAQPYARYVAPGSKIDILV